MPIAIRCGSCGAAFRVPDEFAGKRGKCPKCGTIFVAATGDQATAARSATVPKSISPPPVPSGPPARTSCEPTGSVRSIGAAASITSQPPTEQPQLSGSKAVGRKSVRRSKRAIPYWAYSATAGVLLIGAALGFVYRARINETTRVTAIERRLDPELRRQDQGIVPRTSGFAPKPAEKLDIKKPGPGSSTEDIIAYVEHGIVRIDVYDEFNNRQGLGSGFVIDDRGLVATNYHVLEDAVKADVLFNDGVRYGVEGYLALRPESDLAILQLNGTPVNMRSLDLHFEGEPRAAATVYSIGHPHGNEFQVTNGIVSRVLKTSQLPADTQAFLKSGLSDKVDNLWISHTAQISPGNSGGPLLNSEGEVIGVNSWVNQQIDLGYAIHARTLQEMRQQMFLKPQPLKDHRRPPPTLAQVDSRFGAEVSVDGLKKLGAELDARKYACGSDSDYERLQEFALSLTYILHLRDDPNRADQQLKEILPDLVREAEALIASLVAKRWNQDQIKTINSHAGAKVGDKLEGQFLFGSVERLLEGPEGTRRGLLVKLLDNEHMIFLPLNDLQREFRPQAGTRFLILGISFGAVLRYGDNPREPKEAPVVLTRTLIDLPADGGASGA